MCKQLSQTEKEHFKLLVPFPQYSFPSLLHLQKWHHLLNYLGNKPRCCLWFAFLTPKIQGIRKTYDYIQNVNWTLCSISTATIVSPCTTSTAYQLISLLPLLKSILHTEAIMMFLNTHQNTHFPVENPPMFSIVLKIKKSSLCHVLQGLVIWSLLTCVTSSTTYPLCCSHNVFFLIWTL